MTKNLLLITAAVILVNAAPVQAGNVYEQNQKKHGTLVLQHGKTVVDKNKTSTTASSGKNTTKSLYK